MEMMNITRKQYDNAVKIRDNGYSCTNIGVHCQCLDVGDCGHSPGVDVPESLIIKRKKLIDLTISTYESEHPEEFRKPPDPGEGWRLVRDNEVVGRNDEWFYPETERWDRTGNEGLLPVRSGRTYRRRIAKAPRIYDYRDVDLPEVQELVGKPTYMRDTLRPMMENQHVEGFYTRTLAKISNDKDFPFIDTMGNSSQFIRTIDEPPKIKLTRSELIAIAAKDRGVKPEQIVVEE
jgi:hypothetical protein